MVDMVEARKRARKNAKPGDSASKPEHQTPDPSPEQGKPVLRSEMPSTEPQSSYFPVETLPSSKTSASTVEDLTAAIPTISLPEDQIEFIHKLMLQEPEEDEADKAAEKIPEEEMEVLVFQLGDENYGIDIQQIAEIIRFVEPTEVPNTAAFLDGIISLRGKMIPVINGRRRLGHESKAPDSKSRIVVLQESTELQGMLVDSASQVLKLPKSGIEPTPPVVVGIDAEFIQGVCESNHQLIILLNLERFLEFR
jgi:purine-binding chemotaxis protein CheW